MKAISGFYNDPAIASQKENEDHLLIVRSDDFVHTLKTFEAQHPLIVAGKASKGALGQVGTDTK